MRKIVLLLCALSLVGCGDDTPEMPADAGVDSADDVDGGGDDTPPAECPEMPTPSGPEPDFPGGDLLLGIDTIYPEYERGAKLIMLDARPPFDYNIEHISGAVSIPYYDVEACVDVLPRDTWIVSYCACPHQESVHAAEVLQAAGFTKVHVLDEGYFEWKERGYPVE